jgi:enoyl-CoA hydratase/carnithine racemase
MPQPTFTKQPPQNESLHLSYPTPHILLVTINREKAMNSIPFAVHWAMHALFTWFDAEPELRVAIITGAGKKAFCAGQDLIELGKRREAAAGGSGGEGQSEDAKIVEMVRSMAGHPPSGFAGISRRTGKKPIIAAVNGFALGGGFEIVLNW